MWLRLFRLRWFRLWSIWLSQAVVVVENLVVVVAQEVSVQVLLPWLLLLRTQ
jgi:hypothetical protein